MDNQHGQVDTGRYRCRYYCLGRGPALVFIPVLGMFAIPDILGGTRDILIGNLIKDQFLGVRDWPFGSTLSIMLTLMVLSFAGMAALFARRGERHA